MRGDINSPGPLKDSLLQWQKFWEDRRDYGCGGRRGIRQWQQGWWTGNAGLEERGI